MESCRAPISSPQRRSGAKCANTVERHMRRTMYRSVKFRNFQISAANFISKAQIATVFVGLDRTVDRVHVDPNVHVSISD
eukprot:539918-Prorocentrum_minimum.AAC.1